MVEDLKQTRHKTLHAQHMNKYPAQFNLESASKELMPQLEFLSAEQQLVGIIEDLRTSNGP